MTKKYKLPEESKIGPSQNPGNNTVNEPAVPYGIEEEIKVLPLTEEDLKNCITGDELRDYMHEMIDKHFDK